MNIAHLETFITDFFSAYHCKILSNQDGIISIQLTEELDKALMNRPFYWHYIKSLGEKGKPMTLTLITNPKKREEKGEWIHFGSPRLSQIWNYLIDNEKYVMLFEEINTETNTPLYPWLLINLKISYKGNQKKEELISIGIQLLNGRMIVNMMDKLEEITLKQQISNYCYTLSPLITIKNGYLRMEKVILNYIKNQSHDWAKAAQNKLEREIEMLNHFYPNEQHDEILEKEIAELHNRYAPEIKLEVVNGGVIYLGEVF